MYMCVRVNKQVYKKDMNICIYIYIEREREREGEGGRERERERERARERERELGTDMKADLESRVYTLQGFLRRQKIHKKELRSCG